jgi:hypothetical protein
MDEVAFRGVSFSFVEVSRHFHVFVLLLGGPNIPGTNLSDFVGELA